MRNTRTGGSEWDLLQLRTAYNRPSAAHEALPCRQKRKLTHATRLMFQLRYHSKPHACPSTHLLLLHRRHQPRVFQQLLSRGPVVGVFA